MNWVQVIFEINRANHCCDYSGTLYVKKLSITIYLLLFA